MNDIRILKRSRTEAVLSQRKFFKKTARGRVVKVLRERYLRDDVACGIKSCSLCSEQYEASGSQEPSLPPAGHRKHSQFPQGHFILPDTNIFLHQMDLIESPLMKAPIILLQTVLEEVRHRSLPLYSRLKQLTQSEDKDIWIFYNEYRKDTAVARRQEETPNDRNDRGIRLATKWYNTHLIKSHTLSRSQKPIGTPVVVLLTDDAANRQLAQSEQILCVTAKNYISGLPDAERLADILSVPGDAESLEPTSASSARRAALYPEHLSPSACQAGVKSGDLCHGHFNASQYNYLEGSVSIPSFSKPVLLVGREDMNRAVDGDVVAVQVYPESEWKAPADEVIDQDTTLKNDDPEDSEAEEGVDQEERLVIRGQRVGGRGPSQKQQILRDRQPTGKVVGIIKRNWRALATGTTQQTVFATPVSRSIPRIRLRTRQAPSLVNQKILVTIDRWDVNSKYPEGHFVRALGQVESKEAERESLLLEFEVPFRPFGKAVNACLPVEGEGWIVAPKEEGVGMWGGREDLREMIICSIDPPGCQDIDDALHARLLPNGNVEAGVHIADVSHFVHADTAMDSEAASRGTTVYLVDQRIDMLPSLLGTNLCSLRPHVERLAFSCIWELTPEAQIVDVRFSKSVIASKEAFTYEAAQKRKDDLSLNDPITQSIRLLNGLARKLKAGRMAAGALNLASPEVKIHLQSAESSDPIDVEQKELYETNSLVEEFMLLANISVAGKIQEAFPQTAVLRRHLPPPRANFEKLQDLLMKRKGISLDVSSSGALAASLDQCIDPAEPAFNTLVRIMATRCMLSAEYFASGSVPRDTFSHYGLASPIYTHFTSPIRRYADVLVHRQLSAAVGHASLHATLHSKAHVERVLDNVNRRHRMAQMASRASTEFYTGLALKAREKHAGGVLPREKAFVIRTFRNGVSVFVSSLGLEGLVVFKEDIKFDAETYTVVVPSPSGDGREISMSVFDQIEVQISVEKDKNTQRGKVKMTLVDGANDA
ncbi:exosome catalytic subunit dis3 [Tulasnella sp. 330]|nr:exosome catalytic subunit dis3 [Tulasnella sp. 330]KAG8883763.1 exosome catalytic subunit dis3 [Tulasnella sp. 331]